MYNSVPVQRGGAGNINVQKVTQKYDLKEYRFLDSRGRAQILIDSEGKEIKQIEDSLRHLEV